MVPARRTITVFTPGKRYSGEIDVPNPLLRTTDLLNSANLYWKDPASKSFSDGLLMYNAVLSIDGIDNYQTFKTIQIRQPNIIFFHDGFAELGNSEEKERAEKLKEKTHEEKKTIHLITKVRVNSFFDIQATFHGLFKNKSSQKYIPLSDVILHEIIRQQDKWVQKRVKMANNFIGVNSSYIESSTFV
ncbi:MAG: hypothetical protein KJ990_12350 [Proteobacteria bacterium]|nr:hypothetical protein [Pseudomonadota bacterium]MBU1647947.1 hypothetical protein [Pseudomonadota bacterium]